MTLGLLPGPNHTIMHKHHSILPLCSRMVVIALFSLSLLSAAAPVRAADADAETEFSSKAVPMDQSIETSVDYLYQLLADKNGVFDPARVAPLMAFVLDPAIDHKNVEPAKRFGGRGAIIKAQAKTGLARLIEYVYNPDIPNFLMVPSLLRYSGWLPGSEILTRDKGLWTEVATLADPILVRGKEFEINTPDPFGEAYYRYDLNRLLILFNHEGRKALISVTEQADQSDVGRKGAVLNASGWDFFYSGIPGLNKGLIGWMDTFMYKSASLQIFVEESGDQPLTSSVLLKWLNAGWAGLNVVKRSHIYEGALRFVDNFTQVMESNLPPSGTLAKGIKQVTDLPEVEVDRLIGRYARQFEAKFKDNPKLQKKEFASLVEQGGYARELDEVGKRSILALLKFKCMLGKDALMNLCTAPVSKVEATEPALGIPPATGPAVKEGDITGEPMSDGVVVITDQPAAGPRQ